MIRPPLPAIVAVLITPALLVGPVAAQTWTQVEDLEACRVSTSLGEGGPTVRVLTTNGGVRIRQT